MTLVCVLLLWALLPENMACVCVSLYHVTSLLWLFHKCFKYSAGKIHEQLSANMSVLLQTLYWHNRQHAAALPGKQPQLCIIS